LADAVFVSGNCIWCDSVYSVVFGIAGRVPAAPKF